MVSNFWITISQYFVGIIIFLALLFALMDSSRKYDKYREWPYFVLAIGYFFLVIWALLRATIISTDLLASILSYLQLAGFAFLTIGYLAEQHHEQKHAANPLADLPDFSHPVPETDETVTPVKTVPDTMSDTEIDTTTEEKQHEPTATVIAMPKSKPAPAPAKSKSTRSVPDWVKMLSSDEEIEPADTPDEDEAQNSLTDVKKVKAEPKTEQSLETSLSDAINNKSETEQPDSSTLSSESTAESTEEMKSTPDTGKKIKKSTSKKQIDNGPVDLSYLAARKSKKAAVVPSTKSQSAKIIEKPTDKPLKSQAKREKMMDELFPVAQDTTVDEPIITPDQALSDSTTVLPGEHREMPTEMPPKSSKKALGVLALNASLLNTHYIVDHWQQTLPLLLLLILIFQTTRFSRTRGNSLLALGFLLIFASSVINGSSYVILAIEAIGYVAIGIASWIRIKGKITHHFLTVISGIYCIILALTALLAQIVVADDMGLQLLLLLCTGTLIALLPIIHSLTYNHPAQTAPTEGQHD